MFDVSDRSVRTSRRRGLRPAVALLVGGAMVLSGTAVGSPPAGAAPAPGSFSTSSAAAAPAPGSFSTSFEVGDPAALASTVEIGADGKPARGGVMGATGHLPGSVIDSNTPIAASAENPPAELAKNLADGDPGTKWLAFAATATLTFHLAAPVTVNTYALTSASDAPDRDPAAWRLQGSTDGASFTTVDSRSAQTWTGRGTRNSYPVATPGKFLYYRLVISAPHAGTLLQLADWDLAARPTGSNDQPMLTATGNGPASGLNLKQNAGFTGLHAYQYAGMQTVAGRAFETNVVQQHLSVRVGPKTRLSYRIMPQSTPGTTTYPATYAAVDLHFTDGTYLSQLHPTDQHGVPLTASGQGNGKILYTDQWNAESSALGDVANGKTIDRILFAYDDPAAKPDTNFAGWIDDVKIDPAPAQVDASALTNVVDTRRGTNASGSFSRGNNLPVSALPNGFTFLTPVTDATSNSWEYYYQQANDTNNNPTLQGFAVSHEPSPWMGDRNQLSVMPSAAAIPTGSPTGRALAFTHSDEVARPDYYKVKFLNGLTTELSPTDHGAVVRFTFPADSGSLVFDTVDKNGSFVLDPAAGTLTGWVDNGSGLSVGRSRMFFAGTFSTKPTGTGTAAGGNPETRYATFAGRTVELRLATSFIGLAQARHNAALELTGSTFDQIHSSATAAWQKRLGVVSVSGETDTQRETLYSSLYRLNLYPNSQFENTGSAKTPVFRYASPVAAPHRTASDITTGAAVKAGKVYVNNGFWDTYRTVWPAYSLLYPEVAADLVDGFVQQYRDGGWVARWSSPGYADLMTGTSSDVAFAGAYLRGVPLKDPLATFDAGVKNATVLPDSNGVGRKGVATSIFQKFTDTSTGESVSWQLEGDINDAGLAQMAAALIKDPRTPSSRKKELADDAAYFADRAGQYVNLFDPSTKFFQGRKADGSFNQSAATYDPESWGGVYTETDGWNFAFHAPQDGQGLADLYGGRAQLAQKLDTFFATPELANKPGGYGGVIHEMVEAQAVRMGQLGMSNQPSHHIPYMYDYVQQPDKTQALVRQILQRLYVGDEIGQGYTGDEDNGEMSSWYILSSLGIYPLQSGSPNWVIGSPLFPSVVVHRTNGDLTITAKNNSASNVYVQSLRVNGTKHSSTSVTTQDLAGNARLDFVMGPKPSSWGTGKNDVPASPTKGSDAPTPDQDATSRGVGSLTAANGQDVSALTDNTSMTQTTFANGIPALTWTTDGSSQKVSSYTLTSGSAKGDPTGWTLQASQNGRTWKTVDSRPDETFPSRGQTRPFSVANPGSYRMYRLDFTGGTKLSLAEVELLVKPGSSGTQKLSVVPSSASLTGRTGSTVSATLATFVAAKNAAASQYTASIDWGDGATSPGTITAGQLNSYAVQGSHSYAKPGYYRVAVSVTDGHRTATGYVGITESMSATGGIVTGFDGTCISDDGVSGDCDSGGYSYSRQALAAAGVTQGESVDVAGSAVNGSSLHFTLPAVAAGHPDNAKGDGQTIPIRLPADAKRIAFVGTGTEGDQKATATLTYSDGSTQSVPMNFPDWTLGGGGQVPAGFTSVAATAYRLNGGAQDPARPYLFAAPAITLAPGKTLTGVVMPKQPGTEKDQGRVHVFAIADDGTPAAAMKVTVAAVSKATTGVSTTVSLGKVTGGAPGATLTARVQWGDSTNTADAAVSPAAVVTGTHTWTVPGTYAVHVTVSDGQHSTTTATSVTVADPAQESIAISPASGVPGAKITATGIGFRAGELVSVTLSTPISSAAKVRADRRGRIIATLTIPLRSAAGVYAVTAIGETSQVPATATVSVADPSAGADLPQVRSTLVLSTSTATAGEQVTATGTGYKPNQVVTVTAKTGTGASVRLSSVRANGDGVFTTTFVVPVASGGLRTVSTTNAASIVTAPAHTPLSTVSTPHGTRR